MFDWADLRYFIEVHRTGKLIAAGRRLGVDQTTVARHIQALEQSVGALLFDRTTQGYKLTEAGRKLLYRAEAMENLGIAIEEEIAKRDYAISGLLRIGSTEGFGSHFLARHMSEFNESLPDVRVELLPLPGFINLLNREADIVISPERPAARRIVASKLTDYVLNLYAAPSYLAKHPPINSRKELDGHSMIGYVDNLLYTKEWRYLEHVCRNPRLTLTSTSIVAQHQAALAGAGLAFLPAYMVDPESGLDVILEKEVNLTRSYWIATRSELFKLARVRAGWDFLRALVDSKRDTMMAQTETPANPY